MGDSIATNLFMVGFAYQRGLIPLGEDAILRAIELNGAAVESNKQSFRWGRLAAVDPERVLRRPRFPSGKPESQRLSDLARRDDRAPRRRSSPPTRTRRTRSATPTSSPRCAPPKPRRLPGKTALTEAVARYYFKLLAIKDEYEVARLYTDGDFAKRVAAQFEGDYKLTFHLAPPLSNKPDAITGEAKKSTYGPWMMTRVPRAGEDEGPARHRARRVRQDRRAAARSAQLITDYEALIDELLPRLAAHNHAHRGRARQHPRAHPRLRPRQGAPPEGGEGEGSRAGRELPRRGTRSGGCPRCDQGGGLKR